MASDVKTNLSEFTMMKALTCVLWLVYGQNYKPNDLYDDLFTPLKI